MNAVGKNTAMSTNEMATSALPTSSIVLCAASRGRHALAQIALDVLDDDDGIVDDDADGQHEAEQRKRVERDAHRRHDREGPDQRHGNGDDRDDRGAPSLQEQDDDHDHEQHRFKKRLHHGIDR